MEHSELVKDMVITEQMSTQDRLRQAKHRRMQQLKIWQMRERENSRKTTKKSTKRHIVFDESVVLLEAAARNDIDEGTSYISIQTARIRTPPKGFSLICIFFIYLILLTFNFRFINSY